MFEILLLVTELLICPEPLGSQTPVFPVTLNLITHTMSLSTGTHRVFKI